MMDRSMPPANLDPHAVVGCASGNMSPLAAVTVRLDNGPPFAVPIDDRGRLTLPPDQISPEGHHAAVLTATSSTGRSSTARVRIE